MTFVDDLVDSECQWKSNKLCLLFWFFHTEQEDCLSVWMETALLQIKQIQSQTQSVQSAYKAAGQELISVVPTAISVDSDFITYCNSYKRHPAPPRPL